MKIRIILLTTLLMLVSAFVLALPKIEVYRYTIKDFKTVSIESVLNPLTGSNPWVLDAAPWPKDKKILLLIHGFPMFNSGKMRLTMNGLAVYFSNERKIGNVTLPAYDAIYAVDYPMGFSVRETKKVLADLIDQKTSLFSKGQKFDIFNHSLGGLQIRTAIEWRDSKSIVDKIGHVVFMGTPHNGFTIDELDCFKNGLDLLPVEVTDLDPDGFLIDMLNSTKNIKPVACDYYSIVGLRSWAPPIPFAKNVAGPFAKVIKLIQDKNFKVHDGLISSESAGFDLSPYCNSFKLITLDLNHDYINNHQLVFDAIDKWMIDDNWFNKAKVNVFKDCFMTLYLTKSKLVYKQNQSYIFGCIGGKSVSSINELPKFVNNISDKMSANIIDYYIVFRRPPGFPSSIKEICISFQDFSNNNSKNHLYSSVDLTPNWQYAWYNFRSFLDGPGRYEVILGEGPKNENIVDTIFLISK